jgi:hypothetical protein
VETITAKSSGNCLVCGKRILRGEERLELETEVQWIKTKIMGAVYRPCFADSVPLAAAICGSSYGASASGRRDALVN